MITRTADQINRSVQNALNKSYDKDFDVLAFELLGHDSAASVLRRVKVNAGGEVQLDTTSLDTRYLQLTGGAITPLTNSTTTFQVNQADGTNVLNVDTTNKIFQITGATSLIASGATVKPLIVKGAAGQTANILELQNSAGTPELYVNSVGAIKGSHTYTTDPGTTVWFHDLAVSYNSSANLTWGLYGLRCKVAYQGSGRTGRGLYGGEFIVALAGSANNAYIYGGNFRTEYSGTGVLTAAYGGNFSCNAQGASVGNITNAYVSRCSFDQSSGAVNTITNVYHNYITSPTLNVGGVITNLYGLYIENQNVGSTLNYAIYTNAGAVRFGDKVIFTQTDGNEYIDSLADGYMDYGATTAHRFNANIEIADAKNIVLNTTTGSQLATATGQKLGFWGQVPVVQ